MDFSNNNNDISSNNNNSNDGRPVFRSMAMPAPARFGGARLSAVKTTKQDSTLPGQNKQLPTSNNIATTTCDEDTKMMMIDDASFATSWAEEGKLGRLAYFHPLERTHTKFAKHLLQDILKRLTNALSRLSCHVQHDTDRLAASCTGMDGVEFQIAVWEDRKDTTSCILELQRVAGDAFSFHRKYAVTLLKVPREINLPDQAEEQEQVVKTDRDQGMVLDRLAATTVAATPPVDEVDQAIELAMSMVTSDRYDAVRLGLESLRHMTCPQSSGWRTAVRVAKAVSMQHATTKAVLWQFALKGSGDDQVQYETSLMALQMWVNVWQVLAASQNKDQEATTDQEQVVAALLERVAAVQTHPHHAALACAALDALVQLDGTKSGVVAQQIHWNTVSKAHAVGCAHHAALQQASLRLLQTAGVVVGA